MTDNKNTFIKDIKDFVFQSVSGVYISAFKIDDIENYNINEICSGLCKVYLNSCYHKYGKKDDKYIVDTFNKILSYSVVKGINCLLGWLNCLCTAVLRVSELDTDNILSLKKINIQERRKIINECVENSVELVFDNFNTELKCDGDKECENEYDGNDIFDSTN